MSVKQFEIFHGMALTKLLRSEKPVLLQMIETKPVSEDWRIYTIFRNSGETDLFVKHRITHEAPKKDGYSWQFVFAPNEISRINGKDKPVCVVLVCGRQNVKENKIMEICLLEPDQVKQIFPSDNTRAFSLTVRSEPNRQLQVKANRKVIDTIRRTAIEDWGISDN